MVQSPSWEANWFAARQEITRILRNPKVHYRTHKRPPPVSILSPPNPVLIPTSYLLEIHPNIIHPSATRSPQWFLSLRFPHQDPIHLLSSPIRATCPAHLILLDFITRTILGEVYLYSYYTLFKHITISLFILLSLYSFYSFYIYTNLYSWYSLRIFLRCLCIHLTLSLSILLSLYSYFSLFIHSTLSVFILICIHGTLSVFSYAHTLFVLPSLYSSFALGIYFNLYSLYSLPTYYTLALYSYYSLLACESCSGCAACIKHLLYVEHS